MSIIKERLYIIPYKDEHTDVIKTLLNNPDVLMLKTQAKTAHGYDDLCITVMGTNIIEDNIRKLVLECNDSPTKYYIIDWNKNVNVVHVNSAGHVTETIGTWVKEINPEAFVSKGWININGRVFGIK